MLGIEADLAYSTIKGDDTSTFPARSRSTANSDMKYLGTVRGRLGIAHDQFLFYVTGGFAYSKVDGRLTVNVGAFVASGTDTLNLKGWTVGGGVEYGLTQNLSRVRAEYLYVDFNEANPRR